MANQIRMERAARMVSFLLVEGSSDSKLFRKFVDLEVCSIVVCGGREKLVDAISSLNKQDFKGVLGFADKDYCDFVGYPECDGDIVFTDENDMELLILCSAALYDLIREFGSEERVIAVEETSGRPIREVFFEAASSIGLLRLLSAQNGWALNFDGMDYKFVDNKSVEINLARTVRHVLGRTKSGDLPRDAEAINEIKDRASDIGQSKDICRGHDCARVLGRALARMIGNASQFDSKKKIDQLEKIMRLSYQYSYFQDTVAFGRIREWERANSFRVLRRTDAGTASTTNAPNGNETE